MSTYHYVVPIYIRITYTMLRALRNYIPEIEYLIFMYTMFYANRFILLWFTFEINSMSLLCDKNFLPVNTRSIPPSKIIVYIHVPWYGRSLRVRIDFHLKMEHSSTKNNIFHNRMHFKVTNKFFFLE